jgi:hypothetical protein
MDQGWAALLGALIGGAMTGGATMGVELFKHRVLRRNLSVAVAGEAAAVAEVVRRRQWRNQIAQLALDAQRGNVYRFDVHLPPDIMPISREAMKNAGLLTGDLPDLLPRLVMFVDGISSDLNRLALYDFDDPKCLLRADAPEAAFGTYAELFGMVEEALSVCDRIVGEVKRQYPDVRLMQTRSNVEIAAALEGAIAERADGRRGTADAGIAP